MVELAFSSEQGQSDRRLSLAFPGLGILFQDYVLASRIVPQVGDAVMELPPVVLHLPS